MDNTTSTMLTDGKSCSTMPEGVEHESWYHGLLPREDITCLLKQEGQFLLRLTEPNEGKGLKTVLSVFWEKRARHFIVNKNSRGKVMIDTKQEFDNVGDLVRFHFNNKVAVTEKSGALLLHPVLRQEWELRHDQIETSKLLGEGAFGGVYAGTMTLSNGTVAKVAVKVHKGKQMTKNVIKEICKEARILRRYEHLNIVKFYGVAIEKEPIMLVMELVEGGALDSFLKKEGANISAMKKLCMCYDAACGLDYLHEKGCIHRDVAARNCLITKERRVKISDFGLSREMSNREAKYKLKDLRQRLPIRWLAPETLRDGSYSTKSDVYSFGVFMWEVYENGQVPYATMTVQEVNLYVKEGNRLPFPEAMPTCARDVMKLQCFPQEPHDRADMTQIKKALEKVVRKSKNTNSGGDVSGRQKTVCTSIWNDIGIDVEK